MKYRALRPINHDHTLYPTGAAIELTESEAQPLLEVNAIDPYVRRFKRAIVVPGTTPTTETE